MNKFIIIQMMVMEQPVEYDFTPARSKKSNCCKNMEIVLLAGILITLVAEVAGMLYVLMYIRSNIHPFAADVRSDLADGMDDINAIRGDIDTIRATIVNSSNSFNSTINSLTKLLGDSLIDLIIDISAIGKNVQSIDDHVAHHRTP